MGYTTVLLDADGTLLDFAAAQRSAFFTAMQRIGIRADEALYRCYDSINRSQWERLERGEVNRTGMLAERFRLLFEAHGFSGDAVEANRLYGAALSEEAPLLDGAIALLEALRPLATLAIITNGVPKSQHRRLALSGIDRYVQAVVISGEIGYEKPSPRFFAEAITRCGATDPRKVLVVGDSLTADIAGAEASGLDSCWFHPAGLPTPPVRPCPTYVVTRLDEIPALVMQGRRKAVAGHER